MRNILDMVKKDAGTEKFVLLFQGRTGSTYITDRINARSDVRMYPEVWGGWGFQLSPDQVENHRVQQQDWLKAFYLQPQPREIRAIGFKTKLDDVLDKRYFITFLREIEAKIIHLTRRNSIKLVISEINAKRLFDQSAAWNLEQEAHRLGSFTLDIEKFDAQLHWREQIEQWLESYVKTINLPTLTMYYEEMLDDEESFFETMYGFIGVKYAKTEGKTFKNTPNDLRSVITNYDELFEHYKYTKYESMILDV